MLVAAAIIFALAVLSGAVLALGGLRGRRSLLAAIHGLIASVGFGLLALALRGPQRGRATGTAGFGIIAAAALGTAAVVGVAMLTMHRRRGRVPSVLIGIHATLAVAGFVVLAVAAILG
jgi:hypothetical protein